MMSQTRGQKMAQAAYARVAAHGKPDAEYVTFAKRFPALVHTCGLAQAVAFAEAKGTSKGGPPKKPETKYLEDIAAVLNAGGHTPIDSAQRLAETTRSERLGGYLRLSRDAIQAASWLKRYVEAASEETE
jgi:CRISPR-associated protein Cmr5